MMTYDVFRYIFIIGAILSGVMFAVSVLLFFVLKIPTVIGDLNGSNARKAIESIRTQTQSSSGGGYKSKSGGRRTEAFGSRRLQRHEDGSRNTSKISPSTAGSPYSGDETTVLEPQGDETTVLDAGNETTVLGSQGNETTVLEPQGNETTVLETAVLTESVAPVVDETVQIAPVAGFEIEYDITFIHTNEMIA